MDAHSGVVSDIGSEGNGTVALGRCLEGRSCYADSFKLSFSACCLALGLGLYAAWRDFHRAQVNSERKLTARDQSESGEESAWVE